MRWQEDWAMRNDEDQDRLCCGSLLEAERVDGRIMLRCLSCGLLWSRMEDGKLGIHKGPPSPSDN